MITVLADRHIDRLSEYLHPDFNCITYNPETGPNISDLKQADALLVRTVTRVDEELIRQAPRLKFVGAASAGSDHIDVDLLQKRDIRFASAPGCNARSVAEYVATAILLWTEREQKSTANISVGIVGAGNSGSEVRFLLEQIGFKTLVYDPPRQRHDPGFSSTELNTVLSSDIITLHVPLTFTGEYATFNWLDREKIQSSAAQLFINCSRGSIVDEKTLLEAKKKGSTAFILDVWNNEPAFDDEVANAAFIASPHIAGYSLQAKLKATSMVCNALHEYVRVKKNTAESSLPARDFELDASATLEQILCTVHPVHLYHEQLKLLIGLPADEKKIQFGRLRNKIPLRNEFEHIRIEDGIKKKYPILNLLGLKTTIPDGNETF